MLKRVRRECNPPHVIISPGIDSGAVEDDDGDDDNEEEDEVVVEKEEDDDEGVGDVVPTKQPCDW